MAHWVAQYALSLYIVYPWQLPGYTMAEKAHFRFFVNGQHLLTRNTRREISKLTITNTHAQKEKSRRVQTKELLTHKVTGIVVFFTQSFRTYWKLHNHLASFFCIRLLFFVNIT